MAKQRRLGVVAVLTETQPGSRPHKEVARIWSCGRLARNPITQEPIWISVVSLSINGVPLSVGLCHSLYAVSGGRPVQPEHGFQT